MCVCVLAGACISCDICWTSLIIYGFFFFFFFCEPWRGKDWGYLTFNNYHVRGTPTSDSFFFDHMTPKVCFITMPHSWTVHCCMMLCATTVSVG